MSKLEHLLTNLLSLCVTVVLTLLILEWVGYWLGTLVVALLCFLWNIGVTALMIQYNEGTQGLKDFIQALFSISWSFPFTVYGNYCSPKYGDTSNAPPIDGLDCGCKEHDIIMEDIDGKFRTGEINAKARAKRKNIADWNFTKSSWVSTCNAHGYYLLGLTIGSILRISGRTVRDIWGS